MKATAGFCAATIALSAFAGSAIAKELKFAVIQTPYPMDAAKVEECVEWELDALAKCGDDLDVIVLPEASDRQARMKTKEETFGAARKYGPKILAACSETARRCNAAVFVNALDFSRGEAPRNTTFAFARDGSLAGKYVPYTFLVSDTLWLRQTRQRECRQDRTREVLQLFHS